MKKVFIITLTLITSIFLVSCGEKTTDSVKVKGLTLSYEGFEDTVEENKENYYLDRLIDYKINIYLENDNNLEVSSINISGKEYSTEDFSEESTKNKIIIDEYTGTEAGEFTLKINKLLVVENNKQVKVGEFDFILNLFVKTNEVPNATLEYNSEEVSFTSYSSIISINDRSTLINYSNEDVYIELYENETLIEKKPLKQNDNNIEYNNLLIGTKYSYIVKAKFDLFGEEGLVEETLLEGNFTTKNPFQVKFSNIEELSVDLNYNQLYEVNLNKISLYKENTKIRELDLNAKTISGLEKGTEYNLVFNYEYDSKEGKIMNNQSEKFKTFELVMDPVIRNGRVVKDIDTGKDVKIPTYVKQEREVRGIWVSTVYNIDIPKMDGNNIEAYKKSLTDILDNIKKDNFNTIFFQIRPMNDALYESELAPWSRFVTGKEGVSPGFDLLQFVIEESHARGLELHGWLNPYRISPSSDMSDMADNNFAKLNKELVIQSKTSDGTVSKILNPGEKKVQEYVRDVILEIAEKYPKIDGFHFDDYFYLSNFGENKDSPDYETYLKNRVSQTQSIADFRRMSVTNLIRSIYEDLSVYNSENNTHVKFGISPSGVWNNRSAATPDGSNTRGYQHYSQLYADTKLWIKEGYIDYIIPQLYFDFTNQAAQYSHLVNWWSDVVKDTEVDLIIGMGLYRANEWYKLEIADQLRFNQLYPEVKGATFFTYRDIKETATGNFKTNMDYIRENFWTEAVKHPWESNIK